VSNEYPEPIEDEMADEMSESAEADLLALNGQMAKLQNELNETKEQLLRTMADFQNFRRRNQEQSSQLRQFANESFVTALLPVLDNFERTVIHAQNGATAEQVMAGVRAVEGQLRGVLEGQNVKRIPSVGQPFDPEVHEAIAMEASTEHAPNTVTVEVQPGYRMGERVIRPATVKVAADS